MERGGADVRVYAMVISGKADVLGANVLGAKCPTVPRNSLSTAADDIQSVARRVICDYPATQRDRARGGVQSKWPSHTVFAPYHMLHRVSELLHIMHAYKL